MAYTFTIHDTAFLQDTTFDRLYADSLDDFDSGTVKWRTGLSDAEKKERVYAFLNQGMHDNEKLISINKDDTVCMYIQALIKDNTFIGSNSALVAPITIGKNSLVGAGSVITKNVKDKTLALTRTLQSEIKNYKRKKK